MSRAMNKDELIAYISGILDNVASEPLYSPSNAIKTIRAAIGAYHSRAARTSVEDANTAIARDKEIKQYYSDMLRKMRPELPGSLPPLPTKMPNKAWPIAPLYPEPMPPSTLPPAPAPFSPRLYLED